MPAASHVDPSHPGRRHGTTGRPGARVGASRAGLGLAFELSLPVAELVARGSAVFLAVFTLMRIVGQREAGGLGVTDVLVIVVTILFWSVVIDAASYRWPRFGRLLKSRPRVLVADGRFNHRVMRREFMSDEEVESLLRLEGVGDISTVERAQIEPNGMVSVVRKDGVDAEAPDHRPEL